MFFPFSGWAYMVLFFLSSCPQVYHSYPVSIHSWMFLFIIYSYLASYKTGLNTPMFKFDYIVLLSYLEIIHCSFAMWILMFLQTQCFSVVPIPVVLSVRRQLFDTVLIGRVCAMLKWIGSEVTELRSLVSYSAMWKSFLYNSQWRASIHCIVVWSQAGKHHASFFYCYHQEPRRLKKWMPNYEQ